MTRYYEHRTLHTIGTYTVSAKDFLFLLSAARTWAASGLHAPSRHRQIDELVYRATYTPATVIHIMRHQIGEVLASNGDETTVTFADGETLVVSTHMLRNPDGTRYEP